MTSQRPLRVWIPAQDLLEHYDPFLVEVWKEVLGRPTEHEVKEAVAQGRLNAFPYSDFDSQDPNYNWSHRDHVERIAFLVDDFPDDDIYLNFDFSPWPLVDGNHRLAAAKVLGLTRLCATVEGDLGEFWSRFPNATKIKEAPRGATTSAK